MCLYMFRALCGHHQEVTFFYTASGIITPVGTVLYQPGHGTATYRGDDTRCCTCALSWLITKTVLRCTVSKT